VDWRGGVEKGRKRGGGKERRKERGNERYEGTPIF